MATSAQISLYPLKDDYIPPIKAVIRIFRDHDLHVDVGAMSTVISGETDEVFQALQAAYQRAAEDGHFILVVTLTNACPVPDAS